MINFIPGFVPGFALVTPLVLVNSLATGEVPEAWATSSVTRRAFAYRSTL